MVESRPRPRPTLLVVEDEASLRHALTRGFEKAGFSCHAVATAREGLAAAREARFSAVLTDLRLPDLSGLDVASVLVETQPGVPVVVMTGFGSLDVALEAMRRGARDYVEKPFLVRELVEKVLALTAGPPDGGEERRLRARLEREHDPQRFAVVEKELARPAPTPPAGSAATPSPTPPPLDEARQRFEKEYVQDLLARTGGNVAAAARLAGISRPNFHKKLRALGIDAGPFKSAARRGRIHPAD